jgi:DNA recombination protein RmuC
MTIIYLILFTFIILILLFYIFIQNKEKDKLQESYNTLTLEKEKFYLLYKENEYKYEIQSKNNQEYKNLINHMENVLKDKFTSIANETLNNQSNNFLQKIDFFLQQINNQQKTNTSDFNKLLNPLIESIEKFQQENKKMEINHIASNETIKESLKTLTIAYVGLKEATTLLTSSHKTAGQWGELQLKRLLEYTGLLSYCEFKTQVYMETDDGILKPDVVINLPNDIYIIIDAKTSLVSYKKYVSSIGEEDKKKYQNEYYKSLKTHISNLGNKKYWQQFKNSPEMVIMFLPGENFWQVALEQNEEIIEYAYNLNIIIATPLTLIPLLRMIASLWSKFQISKEGEELKKMSASLYEIILKINDFIKNIGKSLDNSYKTYNKLNSFIMDNEYNLEKFQETYFPLLPSIKKK